jgi:hypothetical protein
VPRARHGQSKRGALWQTALIAVLTAFPIAAEVSAIHKLHIGSSVQSNFDDFFSAQVAKIVMEKIHPKISKLALTTSAITSWAMHDIDLAGLRGRR